MKQIIVIKDVLWGDSGAGAISNIKDIGSLIAGAMCMFTEDGSYIDAAGAAANLLDNKKVMYAVGTGVAARGAVCSPYIDRATCTVTKKIYVASVAQQIVVGTDGVVTSALNLPTLTGDAQSADIKIQDISGGTFPPVDQRNYSIKIVAGETAATLTAKIVAAITNDANAICTSVDYSGTGFLITPTAPLSGTSQRILKVSLGGVLSSATQTADGTGASTLPIYGTGTPAQIEAIWQEYSTRRGNMNKISEPTSWFSETSDVDTTKTYIMYWHKWINSKSDASITSNSTDAELIIAIPTAGATLTLANYETVLNEAFGANNVIL